MKLAISSAAGEPFDPKTWSAAPANLSGALRQKNVNLVSINSQITSRFSKFKCIPDSLLHGLPWNVVGINSKARTMRGKHVALRARELGADHVLCTGSLDVPLNSGISYSIWMDCTWHLLCTGATAAPWAKGRVFEYIDTLERLSLQSAQKVLTFSEHVRQDVISHYDVAPEKVVAVGCGSGNMPAYVGDKDYSAGHLLFVAKHLFSEKGGDLAIEAFRIVRASRPQTRLIVIGNESAVARVANEPGVEAHGFVSRQTLVSFFHGAAMLVQPMLADPWGQVYLEAMKAKAIVVGLRRAAVPELTSAGANAFLVSKPDPQLIATEILNAYNSQAKILHMKAEAAQRYACENMSWDAVAGRILQALGPERLVDG